MSSWDPPLTQTPAPPVTQMQWSDPQAAFGPAARDFIDMWAAPHRLASLRATHQMLASNSKTWRGFYDPRHDDSDYRGLYRNDSRVRNLDRPHGLTGKIEIIR
jgi:hypothetical protein